VNADDFLFLDSGHYNNVSSLTGTVLFRFSSPVYFATLAVFKQKLFASSISPSELMMRKTLANKQDVCVFVKIADVKDSVKTNCDGNAKVVDGGTAQENMKSAELTVGENNGESAILPEPVDHKDDSNKKQGNIQNIIVECSAIPFVDTAGCRLLAQLHADYGKHGIRFVLAGCCEDVVRSLMRVKQCQTLCKDGLYPTIHSAVLCLHDDLF